MRVNIMTRWLTVSTVIVLLVTQGVPAAQPEAKKKGRPPPGTETCGASFGNCPDCIAAARVYPRMNMMASERRHRWAKGKGGTLLACRRRSW